MELGDRGHAALIDRFRIGAELDGGEVLDTDDGLLYGGRDAFPVLMNGAVRRAGGDPASLLRDARSFFTERSRGYTFLARTDEDSEAAAGAGMHPLIERYPVMVRRSPFGEWAVPAGAELRRVEDEAAAREYAVVADAAFQAIGMPAGLLAEMRPAAFLRDDTAAFLAYSGGAAVAAAMVRVVRGVGGIEWVAALEEARGRGLAALCTAAAADAGFSLGADVAWLEASHMGEPVYERMGFEHLFAYRMFVAGPPEG